MAFVAAVCMLSGQLLVKPNGAVMRDAKIYVYNAETTTPRTAFKDYACTVAHPSPIRPNAYGRIPPIYMDIGDYKVVLKDGAGSLIDSYEHLPGGQQATTSTSSPSGFVTGDLKPSCLPIPQSGWVLGNSGTIGNGVSGASARADDDTFNLFVALYNAMPQLVVTPARGSSATLDFQAGKTLALPDFRGRVPVGCDKMGAQGFANLITGASTTTPDQVGASFGTETTTLNVAQLPTFTPSVTISAAGAHAHTGTTDTQGAHAHNGSTSINGEHGHNAIWPGIDSAMGGGGGYGRATGPLSQSTATAGSHNHSISTDTQGSHSHTLTISMASDHTHVATAAAIGSGNAHSNMPPAILVYWHIRL